MTAVWDGQLLGGVVALRVQDTIAIADGGAVSADALGYDTAWVAEHHFSNQYGIMPDVFTYMGYLAAQTSRIRLGTAVIQLAARTPAAGSCQAAGLPASATSAIARRA